MAESNEVIVYGFCDAKCKHRVLTLDQTVALIQEMAANGFQVPEGFIPQTAVNSIIEQNTGKAICLFVGTQEEYDAWTGDKSNCFSIISDDPTLKNILDKLDEHGEAIKATDNRVNNIIDGVTPVSVKKHDGTMKQIVEDENCLLKIDEEIISKKKLLWSGSASCGSTSNGTIVNLSEAVNVGDVLELCITSYNYEVYHKFRIRSLSGVVNWVDFSRALSSTAYIATSVIEMVGNQQLKFYGANSLAFHVPASGNITTQYTQTDTTTLHAVYKVIE